MLRMLRRFSFVCAMAMVIATAILAGLYWWSAHRSLLEFAEKRNVALGRLMASALAPLLDDALADGPPEAADPRVARLGAGLRGLAAGMPVLKVWIVAADGRIVYADIAADVGREVSEKERFQLALAGIPTSQLNVRTDLPTLAGGRFTGRTAETLVPVRAPDGSVRMVFKLCVDVEDSLADIRRATAMLSAVLVAVFVGLYGVLVLVVRRGEITIRRQYDELVSVQDELAETNRRLGHEVEVRLQAEHDLQVANTDLEQRVAERTEALSEEVGERRRVEQELREVQRSLLRQATFDALTGLPNRVLFRDRLGQVLNRARRDGEMAAVLFLDLDNFKTVNDTRGHAAGDQLLHAAAARLQTCVRSEDTVARLGGDEFTIVLQEIATGNDAVVVADKILAAFRAPFDVGGHEFFAPTSIGITLFPQDGDDPDTLLKNADAALYRAKNEGRNSYRFFTAEINELAAAQARLESNLRHALDRGELAIAYQPLVDVATGLPVAVEALLRWNNPELGRVAPNDFVRTAEDKGLIAAIGEWVMVRACASLVAWRDAGNADLRLAVNVSSRQFREAGIVASVDRALRESGLPPACLELELTESLLMEDEQQVSGALKALAQRGVRLSIDDFGTGYSPLNALKRFPFNALKIDREFLRDVTLNPEDARLARAVVDMAHTLGLVVVGEGVETEEQLLFLKAVSCDLAQGHLFCPPVAEADVADRLAALRQSAAGPA